MSHRKPAIERYARATVETKPEYAKYRIKNCENADRLEAILERELEVGPRAKRVAWINQTKARLSD